MADRFPLILNTSTNQIQEIPSGDNLDLTGTGINNAGIITAGNVTIGAATTDLIVTGDARVTGILTIGTSSLKLDGPNNLVNVGTALTLGHTQGLQFHTQNLHSEGFEINQINLSGIATFNEARLGNSKRLKFGDDIDLQIYHFPAGSGNNYISAANNTGIVVSAQNVSLMNQNHSAYFFKGEAAGSIVYHNNTARVTTTSTGINVAGNNVVSGNVTAVDGTFSGNVSVGGTLTYEDVTNIDSVGIITARDGVFIPDNQTLKIGNTSASPDLTIEHVSSGNYNRIISTGYLQHRATSHFFNDQASNFNFIRLENKRVDLRYNGSAKLTTETSGVNITGICTATSFVGNGANLTSVNAATVGGIAAGSFLRSDNNAVFDCDGNNLAFDFDNTGRDSIQFTLNGSLRFQLVHDNSGNDINIVKHGTAANIKIAGNRILTTADEGTGNGLDADTVDGIQGSNIFTLNTSQTVAATKTFNCSGYDYNFDYDNSRTLIRIQRSGTEKLKLTTSGDEIYVEMANSGIFRWETSLVPRANDTYDLGSTSLRWANAYVNDLQLSNESKKDTGGNDVDGTWGDWTLQEGENDIFMINNRTGKKYSITMKEVE